MEKRSSFSFLFDLSPDVCLSWSPFRTQSASVPAGQVPVDRRLWIKSTSINPPIAIDVMSRDVEEKEFLSSFGDKYGYSGQINKIRKQEFSRLEGNETIHVYMYNARAYRYKA